jgi:putative transposase
LELAGKECLFGKIVDSKIVFNDLGRLVVKSWIWLAERYPYVELDEFIIMPNHLHGILVGAVREPPLQKNANH